MAKSHLKLSSQHQEPFAILGSPGHENRCWGLWQDESGFTRAPISLEGASQLNVQADWAPFPLWQSRPSLTPLATTAELALQTIGKIALARRSRISMIGTKFLD